MVGRAAELPIPRLVHVPRMREVLRGVPMSDASASPVFMADPLLWDSAHPTIGGPRWDALATTWLGSLPGGDDLEPQSSDLWCAADIAAALGVNDQTVAAWRQRKILTPPIVRYFGNSAVWRAIDVVRWARATGRL